MTTAITSPVVPPLAVPAQLARAGGQAAPSGRRPLPVARLAATRARRMVYGLACIDRSGRLADNTVMRALGWVPETRLGIRKSGGLVLIAMDPHGVFRLTGLGHLRLPATVRHWCGLAAGDRVLLAAEPERGLLVVHPPAALDAMIAQIHADVLGGEPA